MEKTLSPDERIRRAEEIYYRKKIQATNRNSARVNVSPRKDLGLLKKMFLQIIICALIYTIFYMIKNTNYIFSEDVINKAKEILRYDMNIEQLYNDGKNYINTFINTQTNVNNNQIINEIFEKNDNENNLEENINTEENKELEGKKETENAIEENTENKEEKEELTQMEQDAKDILATKSLIIPLQGTITSRYGPRNPTTPTVPKNHTGIDIAVNEGTVFIASMSGTVESVSSIGDYRKSCENC